MSISSHDFFPFQEGWLWGTVGVIGVVVCLAGSMNLGISACPGVGPGTPDGPSPLPRRAFSSSGVEEGPNSSSVGLNREESITSSPLMIIKGAMHCWSSLAALQRMPVLAPDAFAQACNAWTKVSIFSCLMAQKSLGLEAGGRKSWGQSPWSVGRVSHHPEASCCTTCSLKAATYHRVKCWEAWSLCPACPMCAPKLVLPLALISLHQWGWGVAKLGHLICNPPAWVFHRIWSLSSWPCSGSRVGLTLWCYSQNFWPGPSCQGMAVLGAFGGGGQLGRQTRSITSLGGCTLS